MTITMTKSMSRFIAKQNWSRLILPVLMLMLAAVTGANHAAAQEAAAAADALRVEALSDAAKPVPQKHLVFAHYMPCFPPLREGGPENSYGYQPEFDPALDKEKANRSSKPIYYPPTKGNDAQLQAFIAEIRLAKSAGIDGFFVDLLEDQDNYRNCWLSLLRAAEVVGDFAIGLMPDQATLGAPSDQPKKPGEPVMSQKVLHWLQVAGDSPALLRYEGKPVVASYGVGHPDGQGAADRERKYLVTWLAAQGMPIAYMATHGLDWPLFEKPHAKAFADFAFGTGSYSPAASAALRERALAYWPEKMLVMGEVCPTYYNRSWNYSAPRLTSKYREEWEWNIKHRDRVRWVQIITWNDWGESPLAPDNNHFQAFLPLTRYYAEWFKTGQQPAIKDEWLGIFHRQHPYDATPTPYPYKVKSNRPTDEVEALAFLSEPATLVIDSGGKVTRQPVGAGVQSLIVPFQPGVQTARIERDVKVFKTVLRTATSPIPVHTKPARENLWMVAADSAHPPRRLPPADWTAVRGQWQGTATTREGTGLALTGDAATWSNYTVFGAITPGPAAAGLVGRALGDRHYQFTVKADAGKGQWQIARNDAGKLTVLDSGNFDANANPTCRLRFSCVGEHLIGYLNDQLVSSNVYDYALPFGRAGFTADGTARCDNFRVDSYDPDLNALLQPVAQSSSAQPSATQPSLAQPSAAP